MWRLRNCLYYIKIKLIDNFFFIHSENRIFVIALSSYVNLVPRSYRANVTEMQNLRPLGRERSGYETTGYVV